jgi:hypothetical protein
LFRRNADDARRPIPGHGSSDHLAEPLLGAATVRAMTERARFIDEALERAARAGTPKRVSHCRGHRGVSEGAAFAVS